MPGKRKRQEEDESFKSAADPYSPLTPQSQLPSIDAFAPPSPRSRSPPAPSTWPIPSLPLTESNLKFHTWRLPSPTHETMPPKTPKKDTLDNIQKQKGGSKQAHEIQSRQRAIRIYFQTEGRVNPPDVEQLVKEFREQDRPTGPETPSAKKALETVRDHYSHSEEESFTELSRLLTETSEDLNKAAGIRKAIKRPWQAGCVPFLEDADEATRKLFAAYYTTPTPIPDLVYGFHFEPESDETDILDNSPNLRQILDICRIIHFPFLIIEWKSTWFGGNMADAQNQLSRAGAAAVQVMDRLHRHSGNADPRPADTCVFSMGIDNNAVLFHVHWRGVNRHGQAFTEMGIFEAVTLLKLADLRQLRRVVYNMFQWARGVRRPAVKACVAKLDPSKPTPAILRDPTDSEEQTRSQSGLGNPSVQTDEGIGSSAASTAFALPDVPAAQKTPVALHTAPANFRGRELSESPSAIARQRSGKRIKVQNVSELGVAQWDEDSGGKDLVGMELAEERR